MMKEQRIRSSEPLTAMSYLSRAMMIYEADDESSTSTPPPSVSEASSSSRSEASSTRVQSRSRSSSVSSNSTLSSTSRHRIRNHTRSSSVIRSNLLHKLGVVSNPKPKHKSQAKVSILGNAIEYKEPTKFGECDPSTTSVFGFDETEYPQSPITPTSRRRRIQFNDNANVMPIPMRSEYSSRVKKLLWSGHSELYVNAQRNSLEFAYEGWNWRSVKEEAQFFRSAESGQIIHPVHCHQPHIDTYLTDASTSHAVMN